MIALPRRERETIFAPGARKSGLACPSLVVPVDQLASRVVADVRVFWSSTPPTVITNGSLPGA